MAGTRPNVQKTSDLVTKIGHLARTNVYQVKVQAPPSVLAFVATQTGIRYNEQIELLCSSASLPGSALATHENVQDFYGVRTRYAYSRQHDESLSLEFYVDKKYNIISYFDEWQNYIVGQGSLYNKSQYYNSNQVHRANYPKGTTGYMSPLYVTKFEKDIQDQAIEYCFIDSFPQSINAIPVTYGQADILKVTVSFFYTRYVKRNLVGQRSQSRTDRYTYNSNAKSSNPADYLREDNSKIAAVKEEQVNRVPFSRDTDEYYNNFGDNRQNATNSADFFDGSNTGPFGEGVA